MLIYYTLIIHFIILFIILAILVVLALVLAFNTMKSIKSARKLLHFFYAFNGIGNNEMSCRFGIYHRKRAAVIECVFTYGGYLFSDVEGYKRRASVKGVFADGLDVVSNDNAGNFFVVIKGLGSNRGNRLSAVNVLYHNVTDVHGK